MAPAKKAVSSAKSGAGTTRPRKARAVSKTPAVEPAPPETKPPSRLERRREARKDGILRAAGIELASAGFSRASLEDIAERVNVTKATLYHYFPNKEALYQAWMQHITVEVQERLAGVVDESESARTRLWKLARAEVVILTKEFPDYARLFMSGVDWPEPFWDQIRDLRRSHEVLFRQVVEDGVAAGEFDVGDPAVARYCLQGALAYVGEWFRPGGRLSEEQLADTVADTVVRLFVRADES